MVVNGPVGSVLPWWRSCRSMAEPDEERRSPRERCLDAALASIANDGATTSESAEALGFALSC